MSPLDAYTPEPSAPAQTLSLGWLERGGSLEILEKTAGTNTFVRLAYANDVTSGLKIKYSLPNLNQLVVDMPLSRFDVTTGEKIEQLATSNASKSKVMHGSRYLRYTTSATSKIFRIISIDADMKNLTATALEAMDLTDVVTQTVAGPSIYAGALPSEVAEDQLRSKQALTPLNRRFARDASPRASSALEIPDMTPTEPPDDTLSIHTPMNPRPMVQSIPIAVPSALEAFSGIPSDTIPPGGVNRNLATGSFGWLSSNDAFDQNGTYAHKRFGQYLRFLTMTTKTGNINFNLSQPTPMYTGENVKWISNVLYGAIKATETGVHRFYLDTNPGHRVYMDGVLVGDQMNSNTGQAVRSWWVLNMKAGNWYSFVIHYSRASVTQLVCSLNWATPSAITTFVPVPAANLSPEMHGGFILCRHIDAQSVTRHWLGFKGWDGKSLVMGLPLAASVFSAQLSNGADWTKSAPAGTTIEEVAYPNFSKEKKPGLITDWGSSWTRSGAPRQAPNELPEHIVKFQPQSKGY